jgi:glyoxylase-like metal-dependent hydrolase (beta-lactamase superfamily II)
MDKVIISKYPGRILLTLSVLISLLSDCSCSSTSPYENKTESPYVDSLIRLTKIGEKAILINFGWDAVNAIETTKGIVMVDAGISTSLTSRYRKIIENQFNRTDFLYLINTHCHHDHIRGNGVFPEAQVIGHLNCGIDEIEESGIKDSILAGTKRVIDDYERKLQSSKAGTQEWNDNFTQEIRYIGAYLDIKDNIPFRPPTITFSDSLRLDCGDASFEMKYFGKAHSNSDILIFVPEINVLFTGDLFSKYGRPGWNRSSTETDNEKVNEAVSWITKRMNEIEIIIDGHGQLLTIDDLKSFKNIVLRKYSGDN